MQSHRPINIFKICFAVAWLGLMSLAILWLAGNGSIAGLSAYLSASSHRVLIFIMLELIAVIFLLPSIILTVGAGFLFGMLNGLAYVLLATTAGSILAFYLGRHYLNQQLIDLLSERHRLLYELNKELSERGGTIIFLTRLVPFFPLKASNYYFGAAGFRASHFTLGTFFGIIPITAFNVYLGAVAAQLGAAGPSLDHAAVPWWQYLAGGIALAALLLIIGRLAQKSLANIRRTTVSADRNEYHEAME